MTSLQCPGLTYSSKVCSLCIRGSFSFFVLKTFFFFLLVDFFPRGGCRIYQTRGGGTPQKRQPCRPMWQGGCLFRGGGGADPSIGPRALETLGTPLGGSTNSWGGGGECTRQEFFKGGFKSVGIFIPTSKKKKKPLAVGIVKNPQPPTGPRSATAILYRLVYASGP